MITGLEEKNASKFSLLRHKKRRSRRNLSTLNETVLTMVVEEGTETKATTGTSCEVQTRTFVKSSDPAGRQLGGEVKQPVINNTEEPRIQSTAGCSQERRSSQPVKLPFIRAKLAQFEELRKNLLTRKPLEPNNFQLFDLCCRQSRLNLIWDIIDLSKSPRDSQFKSNLIIGDVFIASAMGKSKKDARVAVYDAAFSKLTSPGLNIARRNNGDLDLEAFQMPVSTAGNISRETVIAKRRSDFVLIDCSDLNSTLTSVSILHHSAQCAGIPIEYTFDFNPRTVEFICSIFIGTSPAGAGTAATKPEAKVAAANDALNFLKTQVYTIKMKKQASGDQISRTEIFSNKRNDDALGEDNVGMKMLQNMGWSGGGLGKMGEGITEPIRVKDVFGREGLGAGGNRNMNLQEFKKKMGDIIRSYAQSNTEEDLMFSAEFTHEERKEIHMIANRFHLKNQSHGKGEKRYLVLSRKRKPKQLLDFLMENGSTDKYDLIPPIDLDCQ